jgi:alkanesulfonate monooxygenase SsuD/methylene tetrahydromethanopterin reductase-like flavin-dependent oxidoreductase (luciferase family)
MNAFATMAREGKLDPEDAADLERLQAAHRQGHIWDAGYAQLVPERWIDRFAVAGTPAEVRERLERVVQDGADEISMILIGSSGDRGGAEQLRRFAETVMKPMKSSSWQGQVRYERR